MYAARSIPFGVVAGLLPLFTTGPAVIAVVVLAAHIQLFDVTIALRRRDRSIARGALIGTVVHSAAALFSLCTFDGASGGWRPDLARPDRPRLHFVRRMT